MKKYLVLVLLLAACSKQMFYPKPMRLRMGALLIDPQAQKIAAIDRTYSHPKVVDAGFRILATPAPK